MRTSFLVAALALAGLSALPRRAHADLRGFASPGPLSSAHAAFDHLCDKCHVPFKGIPNTSCLGCHEGTQKRIASGVGTHARFGEQKCVSCHKDHKGREHEMSPPIDRATFDHAITGFRLDGRHAQAACGQCHLGGKWVGLATTCVGCHADPHHKGALGTACQSCHSPAAGVGWKALGKTREQHHLPLTGGHAATTCQSCHTGGKHLSATSQCRDCHADKHGGTAAPCDRCHKVDSWKAATFQHDFCSCILPGKHQSAPCLSCHASFIFRPSTFVCAGCHLKDRKHEDLGACSKCHSALSWKTKAFDHNKQTKFPIEGRHTEIACESCHTQKGVFKGAPTKCEGCHKVPAHGDFGACAQCHSTAGFAPSSFDHDRKTRFALQAPHAGIACAACHSKFKKGTYAPGPNACALCHGDPHGGQFRPGAPTGALPSPTGALPSPTGALPSPTGALPSPTGALPSPTGALPSPTGALPSPTAGLTRHDPFAHLAPSADSGPGAEPHACLDCHTANAWKPSMVTREAHAGFRFVLENAHAGVPCARCHEGGARAVFRGTATACFQCHTDAHGGRFGSECASCHDTRTWRNTPGFDHGKRAGFALTDSHARVACAGCHGEARDKLDHVARPITCASCHTPTHGLQFGADCASCHRPTSFSDVARFDHRARTTFPLERRHAALRCAACHDATRGARLVAECGSCHGDPHRGGAGSQCQDCHRPDRWLLVRFDHDRSEFPLRGRHFITACNLCHKNNQWTGVRTECAACHILDRKNAMNHPPVGYSCGDSKCHTTFGWHVQAP